METNPSTNTGPCTGRSKETLTVRTDTPTSDSHPYLIQTEGQTYSLPTLIYTAMCTAMCDNDFMTKLVPMLANAITHTIERAVQTVFQ